MAKLAIKFGSKIDVREFRPGIGMQEAGYVIVSSAENMVEKLKGNQLDDLCGFCFGKKAGKRSKLVTCTLLWPDLYMMAVNNAVPLAKTLNNPKLGFVERPVDEEQKPAKPEDAPEGVSDDMLAILALNGAMPDLKGFELYQAKAELRRLHHRTGYRAHTVPRMEITGVKPGRGNHKPRLPDFDINPPFTVPNMPTQAMVLAQLLQEKFKAGVIHMDQIHAVPEFIRKANIATRQEPMRIFRYYFWLLVKNGVISIPKEEPKTT